MFLSISTTRAPATDLGFALHKHPERVQSFGVSVGTAHVFYPEASEARCTAALLLEVDPIALVRGRRGPEGFALGQYVNDRPYAASSMLAMALKEVFRTALTGRCDARPEFAVDKVLLEIRVPALPCRGGEALARRVFEPLGWAVDARPIPLTPAEWGDSRYLDLRLTGEMRLADALNHLYVLLPVLDDAKHYWVSSDEVDKLVRAGGQWLSGHPAKRLITQRYLAHQHVLARSALGRLAEVDDTEPEQLDNAVDGPGEPAVSESAASEPLASEPAADDLVERRVPLAEQRRGAVLAAIRASGARRVGDFGCGEGSLTRELLAEADHVLAVDVSARALQIAGRRLERFIESGRVELIQSSLTYRDDRLAGLDAAVLMEVIEHVDPPRLPALEANVFGHAAPRAVVVTTPNAEHNVRYEGLAAGAMRHRDHRFEWTQAEFAAWAARVAAAFDYTARLVSVGEDDPEVGPPTQMAIFTKEAR